MTTAAPAVAVDLHLLTNAPWAAPASIAAYVVGGRITGHSGLEIPAHVATPADHIGGYSMPEATFTGVVCGHCTDDRIQTLIHAREGGYADEVWFTDPTVRHASVAHVAACWSQRVAMEAEAAAEAPLIRAGIL